MLSTPEAALVAKLSGNAAVNDAVGGRITPQVNTQEVELPCIVYKRLGGAAAPNLGGPGTLARYTFQVDVYAETESGAAVVIAAVEACLFPDGGWRDAAAGVQGAFPDDTAVDLTDDPWRQWTRIIGVWFQAP